MCFCELFLCKTYRKNEFVRCFVVGFLIVFFTLFFVARWASDATLVYVPPLEVTPEDVQAVFFGSDDNNQDGGKKLTIIGAGAAGMYAAYTLNYLGLKDVTNVQILEAHPTLVGGRVRRMTEEQMEVATEVPLDVGAEWIHVQPEILEDLLLFDESDKELPETIVYSPQEYSTYFNGRHRGMNFMRFFYSEFKFYDTTWYGYLERFILPYVSDNIMMDSAVVKIDSSSPDNIVLTLKNGQVMTTDYVFVATPVGQLQTITDTGKTKQRDIEFVPPPSSEKVDAWDFVEYTSGIKAWFEFTERFYPDEQLQSRRLRAIASDDSYFNGLFGKDFTDRNVLATLIVGEKARRLSEKSQNNDTQILELIMEELDEIFDGKASKYLVQNYVQNWSTEEYIMGAYANNPLALRTTDTFRTLTEPMGDKRIYFCGEYAHYDHTASVHGAALSARETVERFLKDQLKQVV